MESAEASAFVETNVCVIDEIIADVARRQRLRHEDLDEFRSLGYLKLVEHDYAVLRSFQGSSSLRTYLTVVLQRVLLDYRNREWGRWRPSAQASRLGPAAVHVERMVTRDGYTPAEALASGPCDAHTLPEAFLTELHGRTATRGARATLGEDAIPEQSDPGESPEDHAARRDRRRHAWVVRGCVQAALHTLDSEDHLILTLRFRDGLSIADTARVLGLEAKPLYRRIERILVKLRLTLSGDVTTTEMIAELAGECWSDDAGVSESGWWWSSKGNSERTDAHPAGDRHRRLPRAGAARGLHRRQRGHVASSPAEASL